jgi:hypothetical protein
MLPPVLDVLMIGRPTAWYVHNTHGDNSTSMTIPRMVAPATDRHRRPESIQAHKNSTAGQARNSGRI